MQPLLAFCAAALILSAARPSAAQFAPVDPARVETKHLIVTTSVSPATAAPGDKLTLHADVAPKPKMHVYAPDQKEYIPIRLEVATVPAGFKLHAIQYPAAESYYFEPLKETQRVYSRAFRITQPLVVARDAPAGTQTIKGTIRYQACDDTICYLPQTVAVSWRVEVRERPIKSQAPNPKSQRTPNVQFPISTSNWGLEDWECVGTWDLVPGI